MKAIVVKNEDFQTIGFEVTIDNKSIYSWGISPTLKWHWQKEVDTKNHLTVNAIFELIRLDAVLNEQENAYRLFFAVAEENNLIETGKPVNCEKYNERVEATKARIEKIIKNIV